MSILGSVLILSEVTDFGLFVDIEFGVEFVH